MNREEQVKRVKELLSCGALSKEASDALKADYPELNESEDEKIRKMLIARVRTAEELNEELREWIIAYLEKQKEQTHKNESILRVEGLSNGEYLLYNYIYSFCAGEGIHMCKTRGDLKNYVKLYYPELKETVIKEQKEQKPAASWTIRDARPGDILNSARVQATIIFKGFNPDGKHIDAYCALQKGIFIAQEIPWDRDFELATQVRKDALFDAMVRKGYLWDAENKRLNKAVQQPTEWSEEDKETLNAAIHMVEAGNIVFAFEHNKCQVSDWLVSLPQRFNLQSKQEWSEEDEENLGKLHRLLVICQCEKKIIPASEYDKLDNWLKNLTFSLKKRNEDIAKLCSNEWNEEDEELAEELIKLAEYYTDTEDKDGTEFKPHISWLKALRDRFALSHWKPSEEQMSALKSTMYDYKDVDWYNNLLSLYNDLKKLM